MTDNEIIKALECCGSNGWGEEDKRPCDKCPMQECEDCEVELPDYALNLINRQKAEIENLREENEIYRRANFLIAGQRDARDKEIVCLEAELESVQSGADLLKAEVKRLEKRLKTAKSEAIREFAERLKSKAELVEMDNYFFTVPLAVPVEDIDNLVKEMTEDKKNDPE